MWFQNRRQAEKKRSMRFSGPRSGVPASAMGLRRSTSSPCVSLLTTSGGRAALGADSHETPGGPTLQPAPLACALEATTDGRGIIAGAPDREIWQRMESSSALNSCSDVDDAPAASDEDDKSAPCAVLHNAVCIACRHGNAHSAKMTPDMRVTRAS